MCISISRFSKCTEPVVENVIDTVSNRRARRKWRIHIKDRESRCQWSDSSRGWPPATSGEQRRFKTFFHSRTWIFCVVHNHQCYMYMYAGTIVSAQAARGQSFLSLKNCKHARTLWRIVLFERMYGFIKVRDRCSEADEQNQAVVRLLSPQRKPICADSYTIRSPRQFQKLLKEKEVMLGMHTPKKKWNEQKK